MYYNSKETNLLGLENCPSYYIPIIYLVPILEGPLSEV